MNYGGGEELDREVGKRSTLILIAVVILIIGTVFIISAFRGRTLKSSPGQAGNLTGNLYSLGLFCENDGRIYFSNFNDDGALYSMSSDLTDFRKLSSDKVRYINADDYYIYYSRMNNLREDNGRDLLRLYPNGLFRIRKNGRRLKMLYNDIIGTAAVNSNYVVYQRFTDKGRVNIICSDISGDGETVLAEDDCIAVSIYDGLLYYSGVRNDHSIHSVGLADGGSRVAFEGSTYMPAASDKGIYYIATTDNYTIHLIDSLGNDSRITDCRCSSYNISADGRYIFYQRDDGEENGIEMYDTSDRSCTHIYDGDFKNINLAGGYCFFFSFDEETVYAYKPGGSLNIFNPPCLEK